MAPAQICVTVTPAIAGDAMHKLIVTSLIAFFISTGAHAANSKAVTIQFDGLCDTMTLTKDKALVLYASVHVVGCPAGRQAVPNNPIPGVGIVVKRNPGSCGCGRDLAVSDTQPDALGAPVAYVTKLEYPLVTGGKWTAYATSDGAAITQVGGGTYTVK